MLIYNFNRLLNTRIFWDFFTMSSASGLEFDANNTTSSRLYDLSRTLNRFIYFLEPYRLWLDTYNAHFLLDEFWTNESIVNRKIRNNLEELIDKAKSPFNLVRYYHETTDKLQSLSDSKTCLEKLLLDVAELRRVWNQEILTAVGFFSNPNIAAKYDRTFQLIQNQNRFMNSKKVHEVDTMSKLVAELCEIKDVQTVGL